MAFRFGSIGYFVRMTKIQRRTFCNQDINGDKSNSEHDLKNRLLDASLRFVLSNGWTPEAVALGAKELQYPEVVHGLFRDPGASLVRHFIITSNNLLVEHMKTENARLAQNAKIKFTSFVGDSLKYRLQLNVPYMDRMPEALSIATRPDQLPESLRLLLRMSDDVCYYGGDRSTDMSWYTKRSLVAAVYASTELYMLRDRSIDYEDTWQFMSRRFDDLENLSRPAKEVASIARTISDAAYAFYIVGRNAVGANTESKR